MSISTGSTDPKDQRSSAPSVEGARLEDTLAPAATPRGRPAVRLFAIRFAAAMSDRDLALLEHALDLSILGESHGFARLDHQSGLFLERDDREGDWVLEARTWGHPAPDTVHSWQVLAAAAARRIDPAVTIPERTPAGTAATRDRPVGRVANKRFAQIRRRMVGLP